MELEQGNIESLDIKDEYEMVPFGPMMCGCSPMNMMSNMNPFNDSMFINGFNPMAMMYGNEFMNYYDQGDTRMQKDMYKEKYKDKHEDKYDSSYKDVDVIVRKIERYNPGIFRTMNSYGIPYAEARRLVRRIVRLTLMYYDE